MNTRPIETNDIGQILYELLQAHAADAEEQDCEVYISKDYQVAIDAIITRTEHADEDRSNLMVATNTGETFAVRVIRVG